MIRDMDLIRSLALKIEASEEPVDSDAISIEGRSPEEMIYHVRLMVEADLVVAADLTTRHGARYLVARLSWKGHDFVEAAKNDSIWGRIKTVTKDRGVALSLDALVAVLKKAGEWTLQHGQGWISSTNLTFPWA